MNLQTSASTIDFASLIVPDKVEVTENIYFPTQIFSFQLPDEIAEPANEALVGLIRAERDRDQKGIQRSNFRALGGWHSRNDLHEDAAFRPLTDLVAASCAAVSETNGYDTRTRLKTGTMWAIINPPGSSNRAHIHPSALWSGVYYVQTPKGCGDIEFVDPRTEQLMNPARFQPNRKRPKNCWSKVNFTPKAGKLLIFPSWLYHSVSPNLSTLKGNAGERIIVSFNLNQSKS